MIPVDIGRNEYLDVVRSCWVRKFRCGSNSNFENGHIVLECTWWYSIRILQVVY